MDAKQALEILRNEDNRSASPENADKGIWTHTDMPIESANQIADLIEQQAEYSELGRLALDALSKSEFEGCDGVCDSDCSGSCVWNLFCQKRAELKAEPDC